MRVLYLSYTGLLEPLGQSQVFAYLRLLSREHQITLVTFEKPADLDDGDRIRRQRDVCEAHGVRWLPQRYHQRPRLLATAWDLITALFVALREVRRGRIEAVHCRSYIPSFVALIVKWLTGRPFIFDMRALWPEEMVAVGRLTAGSPVFRLLKGGERACLMQAAAVVSLTQAAVIHLRSVYGGDIAATKFTVIPTCVDLDLFSARPARTAPGTRPTTVGSVGSVLTGWFRLDWLAAFYQAVRRHEGDAAFKIITPENPDHVRASAQALGAPSDRLEVFGVSSSEVPEALVPLDAVAMFFTSGVAKMGSCPTRLGEVLARGVPAVVNPGVGDIEAIVRDNRVGVVITDSSPEAMARGAVELLELLNDPHLPARCRQVAEVHFSLARGAEAYAGIYRDIDGTLARTAR